MKFKIDNEDDEEVVELKFNKNNSMGEQVAIEIDGYYGMYFRQDKTINIYRKKLEKMGFTLTIE